MKHLTVKAENLDTFLHNLEEEEMEFHSAIPFNQQVMVFFQSRIRLENEPDVIHQAKTVQPVAGILVEFKDNNGEIAFTGPECAKVVVKGGKVYLYDYEDTLIHSERIQGEDSAEIKIGLV